MFVVPSRLRLGLGGYGEMFVLPAPGPSRPRRGWGLRGPDYEKNNKLYKQAVCSFWLIATLLANCHSCLYGNQVSQYFGVPTPDLEDYLV